METEKNKYETQLFFLIPSSKKCFFFFLTLISSWTSLKKAKQKVQKTSSFF